MRIFAAHLCVAWRARGPLAPTADGVREKGLIGRRVNRGVGARLGMSRQNVPDLFAARLGPHASMACASPNKEADLIPGAATPRSISWRLGGVVPGACAWPAIGTATELGSRSSRKIGRPRRGPVRSPARSMTSMPAAPSGHCGHPVRAGPVHAPSSRRPMTQHGTQCASPRNAAAAGSSAGGIQPPDMTSTPSVSWILGTGPAVWPSLN